MICPICGREYDEHPALSRVDNETYICARCGSAEALCDAGLSLEQTELLLSFMYPEMPPLIFF